MLQLNMQCGSYGKIIITIVSSYTGKNITHSLLLIAIVNRIIAERKATSFAVRVLGWRGVVSGFRNAICHTSEMQLKVWLVDKHPSRFGMQLKYLVYKKLSTLTVSALNTHYSKIKYFFE